MCAPPFATKQRPPIWKILDPPLNILQICVITNTRHCKYALNCNPDRICIQIQRGRGILSIARQTHCSGSIGSKWSFVFSTNFDIFHHQKRDVDRSTCSSPRDKCKSFGQFYSHVCVQLLMNDQRNRNLLFPEVILFRLRGNPSGCMQRNDWSMNIFYFFDVHVWSGLAGFPHV